MIRQFRARLTSLSSCNFVKVSTCLQHLQKPTHYATDSCTISMNSLIRISFRGYSTTAKDAIQITAFNFNKEVAQWTQGLIVLVLYSEASPDCKQYVANLKSCASKYNTSCERVRIALINCDLEHQIARQFQVEITGIPATYFLFKGSVCDRHIGVMHLPQITSAIAMLIKSLGEEFPSKKPQESSNGSLENSSALLLEDSVRALEEKNVDEAETIAKKVIEELASDLNSFKTSIGCGQRKMTPEMLNKLKDNFAAQQTLKALVILAQCALISEKSAHEYVNRIQTDFIWAVKEQREVGDIVAQFEMSTIAPLSRADTVETLSLATSTSQEEYPRVLKLAHWYYKNQDASKAIELLLDVISKESKWGIQRLEKNSKSTPARRMIVLIFDALGNDSQMVKEGRKKLSTYLFC